MVRQGHSLHEAYYIASPAQKDKENYASSLSKYAAPPNNNDDSDLDDFEVPPPQKLKKNKKKSVTVAKPTNDNLQLVPVSNEKKSEVCTQENIPTSQIMQMYN